jgi:hypothetical protein
MVRQCLAAEAFRFFIFRFLLAILLNRSSERNNTDFGCSGFRIAAKKQIILPTKKKRYKPIIAADD